jgi:hypothetical protein
MSMTPPPFLPPSSHPHPHTSHPCNGVPAPPSCPAPEPRYNCCPIIREPLLSSPQARTPPLPMKENTAPLARYGVRCSPSPRIARFPPHSPSTTSARPSSPMHMVAHPSNEIPGLVYVNNVPCLENICLSLIFLIHFFSSFPISRPMGIQFDGCVRRCAAGSGVTTLFT